ncbi:hypothetical protein SAY87_032069 [Trapa incisa]|uniref:Uncharacterized protein n=1 Tax=Trapa incisa TaxID=236973 RepID=A0AAN7KQR2_9MYRT|nr:hypothetical protein SAY87_032069 [Trapa incisa]
MPVSDAVVRNLTTIYVAAIAAVKAYGCASGRSFGGAFVLVAATALVGLILIGTLTWDVSHKAKHVVLKDHTHEMCKGGICWHGVAVKSPASQVRFQLPPQHQRHHLNDDAGGPLRH